MHAGFEQVSDDSAKQNRIYTCKKRLFRLQLNFELGLQNRLFFDAAEDALIQVLIVVVD